MNDVRVIKDLFYTDSRSNSQALDLWIPEGENLPLIVYLHGGAFKFGDKSSALMPYWLIQHGFAMASVNYRLSGEAVFPAAIEDAKSAIRWLRAHSAEYGFDPKRVGVWGESAGGYLAAFLGAATNPKYDVGGHLDQPSTVQAVVDYYGPIDFLTMDSSLSGEWATHSLPDSPESLFMGAPITAIPERLKESNPITHLTSNAPPYFLASGNKDVIVPIQQSLLLEEALSKLKVPVEMTVIPEADHVFESAKPADLERLTQEVLAFLQRTLA